MALLQRFAPALILIFFPLIFVGRAVFTGQTIGAFDSIVPMMTGSSPSAETPWDVLQADAVLQFAVWRELVLDSWASSAVPTWNPYALAGTPLLENSQSGALYPIHIVLGLLRVPAPVAIDLLAWFHLAIAGLGMARLTRSLGGCPLGGIFAGLAFQSTPFLLRWTPLASVPTTICWIPWLLSGVIELGQTPNQTPARSRLASGSFLVAVGATAMMLLGGHLQFAAYGLGAAFVALLWTSCQRNTDTQKAQPLARVLSGVIALGLGTVMAMAQLLPVLDYSQFSHRRNTPSEAGYQAYVGLGLPAAEMIQRLGLPLSQGNPDRFASPELPISEYWPAVTKPGANFAESATTVGLLALAPLGLLIFRRDLAKQSIALLLLAGVGLLLASGSEVNRLLYFGVPGWSSTGSPGRAFVLALIGLIGASGLAVSALLKEPPVKKELGAMLGLAALIGLLGCVIPADPKVAQFDNSGVIRQAILQSSATHILLGLLTVLGICALAVRYRQFALPGIVALSTLWVVGTGTFRLIPSGSMPTTSDADPIALSHDRYAYLNEAWTFVGIPPAQAPPNTASFLRRRDLGGYDSLLHRDTVALLAKVNGGDPAPPANGNMMFIKPSASQNELREAGVQWLVPRSGEPIAIGGTRLSENATWIQDDPGRLRIRIESSGRIVVRERNIPGWKAVSEGKAVALSGTEWLEFDGVEVGKEVTLTYSPPRFQIGAILSAVGVILLALFRWSGRQSDP